MAKAKTTINAPKVPDAEPVGDHAQFKTALSGENASVDLLPAAEATATGLAAPVATNSISDVSADIDASGESSTELATVQDATGISTASADTDQDTIINDGIVSDPAHETQSPAGVISKETTDAILTQNLGVSSSGEQREFYVLSPVRHNNIRYSKDDAIILTETEHALLHKKQLVEDWETGSDVD